MTRRRRRWKKRPTESRIEYRPILVSVPGAAYREIEWVEKQVQGLLRKA